MTVSELAGRVTVQAGVVFLAAALVAASLGHPGIALGIVAGGALGVLNFRWLARSAAQVTSALGGGPVRGWWLLAAGVRFLVMFAALSAVLATGWAHPLALMAALAIVPALLIVHGLRTAHDESH